MRPGKPEAEANALLDVHHPERTPPIPVEPIAVAAGYQIGRSSSAGPDTAFLARSAAGEQRILGVNSRLGSRRQRCALAHALGHGQLHLEVELLIDQEWRVGAAKLRGTPEQELAANTFAAALLMPAAVVREELGKAMGHTDGRGQSSRERLMWALAAVFDVTELAVAHRLIGLGMMLG